ncbi:MAG: phosphoenolpyruvate carboxylase [Candidatus Didemnitutus sp.]|nr:phosphoenolpyruvate carboxylase [Candidatus Didemnitutus sp.]
MTASRSTSRHRLTGSAIDELPELRASVRTLGARLGSIIERLEGAPTYRTVERLRVLAKASRAGDKRAGRTLASVVKRLTPAQALNQAMAFTMFFELVNLAEENFRIRLLRARRGAPAHRKESIFAAVAELKRRGVQPSAVQGLLDQLAIELVFTAHPTEAKRRTLLTKLSSLAEILRASSVKQLATSPEIAREIVSLWLTDRGRPAAPTVMDEARTGLWYFQRTLYTVLPQLQRDLVAALQVHYPKVRAPRGWLRFGSWIGGDRDGNPYVTAKVTTDVLKLLRQHAVAAMERGLQRLAWSLTVSDLREPVHPSVARLAAKLGVQAAVWPEIKARHRFEPYRQLVFVLRARIADKVKPLTVQEMSQACAVIERALAGSRAEVLAEGTLRDIESNIATFGLHTGKLDLRQHSGVHARTVAGLLASPNYPDLPETEKCRVLARALRRGTKFATDLTPEAQAALEALRAVRAAPPEALGIYIISMAAEVSDVMEVVLLQSVVGTKLPVAPLFETLADLQAAPRILDELFANKTYRRWLKRDGDSQHVMLGYSDSNKDCGYLAANWGLNQAQAAIVAVCKQHEVRVTLFHGRGGSIARGGGPAAKAVLAQPIGLYGGGIRITEQGEVLSTRYHDVDIAHRVLEQMTYGVLLGSHLAQRDEAPIPRAWVTTMEAMSAHSTDAYRTLVRDDDFLAFWQVATPIDEIGTLKLGSRPTYRKEGPRTLDDLRAIPWVFSWMQSRFNLPGWYGLGSALEMAASKTGGLARLQTMYRKWRPFQLLVDNAQLTLCKADMSVAEIYADLDANARRRNRIFEIVRAEFARTQRFVLAVSGQKELLGAEPVLANSIRLRNPYIDPLNYLQVEMLRRLRSGKLTAKERDDAQRVVELTVNGIAAGLKNTG